MQALDVIQGSPEWRRARAGSLGASEIADVCAKLKSGGYGATRAQVMARLLCERLTGVPTETFCSAAMQSGIETEPEARAAYEFHHDCTVQLVGLVKHSTLAYTHCSPDGLIGEDGLCEIKCPQPAQHLDTLLTETIKGEYLKQMQWQMCVTGRTWCDFVSYSNLFPPHIRLYVKRVTRDDALIAELEREVRAFLAELAEKYVALTTKFDLEQAA